MSVVVGWCHPTLVASDFCDTLLAVHVHDMTGPRHIVERLSQFSSANVSWARNQIVQRFLTMDGDPEYLLMVDSDMVLPATIVDDLLAHADPVESPIVGALCFIADSDGVWPTIYQMAVHPQLGPRMVRLDDYDPNTLVTVAATGAACLLIHRSVLEAVVRTQVDSGNTAFPAFEETSLGMTPGAKTYPCGEDITFCLRAGALGFQTKVATGVEVGHLKSTVLTSALHREQRSRA